MVSYKVTEFPPQVFRVMLRYLYTGQLRFMDQNEECQDCSMSGVDQRQKKSFKVKDDLVSKVLKLRKHIEICRNDSVPVYFEDLFRISERYEIPTLKALSLKAMQCSLNLSVAILMLAKCEPQSKEESASELSKFPKTVLNRLQWLIAKDSVKEYIQFFGSEVNASETDQEPWQHISIQECRSMIDSLGNGVLANLYRFWG
ncbi:hypothetical protein FBU30_007712 [Linnemannia zychae]|nr:hypothetical protein FBU30_007712 [Linnemannia zychae]